MSETIAYYEKNLEQFLQMTQYADMVAVRKRFTCYLPEGATILDAGCGSGRDALAFKEEGYQVMALDACKELCEHASKLMGQEVVCERLQDIGYQERFDGIWACASFLHIPSGESEEVLKRLIRALKPEGILYLSVKYGAFEGMRNGRYFTDYTEESLRKLIDKQENVEIEEMWLTEDTKVERQDNWLNVILKR